MWASRRYRADIAANLWQASSLHHQEIWQDFADKKVFPTVEEWRLFTEPWIFVVDGQGIIRGEVRGTRDRQ